MPRDDAKKHFDQEIAEAAQTACLLEVQAPKVGNVNCYHDFENVTLSDFQASAYAIYEPLGQLPQDGIGATIEKAVLATRRAVGTNTNLGIILLLVPLAAAWRRLPPTERDTASWQEALRDVLATLTPDDAAHVYRAIRVAGPGGMGSPDQYDVMAKSMPLIPLMQAMALAADRDLVARQYTTKFAYVFDCALPALRESLAAGLSFPRAIAQAHLTLLARVGDSLIGRKLGSDLEREAQARAAAVLAQGGFLSTAGRDGAKALDDWLRADGHRRNPGATADLIAAAIFVQLLAA